MMNQEKGRRLAMVAGIGAIAWLVIMGWVARTVGGYGGLVAAAGFLALVALMAPGLVAGVKEERRKAVGASPVPGGSGVEDLEEGFYQYDFRNIPRTVGLCSDRQCPCPETRIPRGSGYLYISEVAVAAMMLAKSGGGPLIIAGVVLTWVSPLLTQGGGGKRGRCLFARRRWHHASRRLWRCTCGTLTNLGIHCCGGEQCQTKPPQAEVQPVGEQPS